MAKQQALTQVGYGVDIFRQQLPSLKIKAGVEVTRLSSIFYISKGMVLHAIEKGHQGEFTLDDLLSEKRDTLHSAAFVGSKDLDAFGIRQLRYLEYGAHTRVPSLVSRPTFPELYDREKLMVAEFGGFALDDGKWDQTGFLKCNHSVFILMPWHHLKNIKNKSIAAEIKEIGSPDRGDLEAKAKQIDLWYVLGFLNSEVMQKLLEGVARSAIANRRQPDDLRNVPLPMPNSEIESKVVLAAKKAFGAQRALFPFRLAGWSIDFGEIRPPAYVPPGIKEQALDLARVSWGLSVPVPSAKTNNLIKIGNAAYRGKQKVFAIPEAVPGEALEWLVHQFNGLADGMTFESAEREKLLVPATPEDAVNAFKRLVSERTVIDGLLAAISKAKDRIETTLRGLFQSESHPPIHE
jgi:hypothetical protein